ncbi:phage tail-collar fiber domain-containing protein [Brucella intermedia]|uniref:phage tail-collar fiber domain-containing protein n=1 Tax=Brucella intermedia TaxID=94625 RepID=UPI0034CF52A2
MAQNTFALMTNLGRAKEAAAIANGTAVVITHIAIGDGTTVPSGGETALYHEVARKAISGHGTVVGASNVAYFDIFLEADEGPYTIREAGLIDQDGDLIAIARYDPPISKPIPSSGQTVEGTIRLEVAFSNIANITIIVDPAFKVSVQRLSRLPWLPVISMVTTAPPATPTVGAVYIIPAGATGAWAGQSGKIAEYTAAGWAIMTPDDGHGIGLPDGRVFVRVNGAYTELLASKTFAGLIKLAADPMDLDDDKGALTPSGLRQAVVPPAGLDNLIFNSWFTHSRRFPSSSRQSFIWASNSYWFDHWKNVTGQAITATWEVNSLSQPLLSLPAGAKIKTILEAPNFDAGVLSALVTEGAVDITFAGSQLAPTTIHLDKNDVQSGRKYCVFDFSTSPIGPNLEITIVAVTAIKIGRLKCERGKKPTLYAPHQPYIESMILDRYFQRLRRRVTFTATAANQYFSDMVMARNEMMQAPQVGWNVTTSSNAKNFAAAASYTSGVQITCQSVAAGDVVLEYEITLDADF